MMHRRMLLRMTAASLAASGLPRLGLAQAQDWPSRAVKIIAPSAPGGSLDILSRLFGKGLSQRLGQPFVIENRGGGGGNIGYDATAKSAPDGYTIMIASDPLSVNPSMYSRLPFDPVRDFAPIVMIATLAQVLAVHPKVPAQTFAEFVALARAKPKTLNVGTAGTGSPGHLALALLAQAGVELVHVPYRGAGPALIDGIAGQIDASIVTLPATIPMIRQGQLRALAVTSPKRARFLPEAPAMSEVLPGVVVDSWQAFFAPAATPRPIIDKLNGEFNALLKSKEVTDAFETQAFEAAGGTPEELGKFLRDEIARLAPIIKAAGIRSD